MQINLSSPTAIVAQVTGFLKPWLMFTGVVLAAAIAVSTLGDLRLPLVHGGQEQMWLAALLVWAGR